MKTLNLNIDLKDLKVSKEDEKLTPSDVMIRVVLNVVMNYSQQQNGLLSRERKQYYRIKDTLDKAITDKVQEVSLEDEDIGFIRKCFREAKLNPTDLLKKVEENIEAIKDR